MRRAGSQAAYYRHRVPTRLREAVRGRTLVVELPPKGHGEACEIVRHRPGAEVKFSLRVPEGHPAYRERWAAAHAQTQRWFSSLTSPPRSLIPKERSWLAGEIYRMFAQGLEDDPVLAPSQWERISQAQRAEFDGTAFALMIGDDARSHERRSRLERRYGSLVDVVLSKHGMHVDDNSRQQLIEDVAKHSVEATAKLARNADGDYRPDSYAERFAAPPTKPSTVAASGISLLRLFDGWAKESAPNPSTVAQWRVHVRRFIDFVGHDDADRLARGDIVRWKDHLLGLGNSPKTINGSKLAALKSALRWGVDNDFLKVNVADRVSVRRSRKPTERMRGFDQAQAAAILQAAAKERSNVYKWVPLLCAQSGARVSEICQLRAEDIGCEDQIWFMHIRAEAGGVKNVYSERKVPLHTHVIRSGFRQFVEQIGRGPLFYKAERGKPDAKKPRHKVVAKNVANWVRGLGLDVGRRHRIDPNHGWRHFFRTAGRKLGADEDVVEAILGHAPATVGRAYGEIPLDVKARVIAMLPLPGVYAPVPRPVERNS